MILANRIAWQADLFWSGLMASCLCLLRSGRQFFMCSNVFDKEKIMMSFVLSVASMIRLCLLCLCRAYARLLQESL